MLNWNTSLSSISDLVPVSRSGNNIHARFDYIQSWLGWFDSIVNQLTVYSYNTIVLIDSLQVIHMTITFQDYFISNKNSMIYIFLRCLVLKIPACVIQRTSLVISFGYFNVPLSSSDNYFISVILDFFLWLIFYTIIVHEEV